MHQSNPPQQPMLTPPRVQRPPVPIGMLLFNLCILLLGCHQRAIVVIWRSQWGIRALRWPCVFALIFLWLWASISQDPFMWLYLVVWAWSYVRRRMEAAKLATVQHSQYDGMPPRLLCGKASEFTAKRIIEPVLTFGIGGMLSRLYLDNGLSLGGLPLFFFTGAFSMLILEAAKQRVWDRRLQAMHDNRIEQQQMVAGYHERYGE